MADVWKSIPKHFCKFCKCWIADNKPSRDFHEKGKKHQENVQLKIAEVRKKSVKDEKKKAEENSYMIEMEEAAKKAFIKDLKEDPKLAEQYLAKARARKQTVEDKKPNAKGENKASVSKKSNQPETKTKGTWHLTYSPEGYPYYWNDITAEVSWTAPEGVEIDTDTGQTEPSTDHDAEEFPNEVAKTPNLENETYTEDESNSTDTLVLESSKTDVDVETNKELILGLEDKDLKNKEQEKEVLNFDPSDISSIPLPGDIPLPDEPVPPGESSVPPPLPPFNSVVEENEQPEEKQVDEDVEDANELRQAALTGVKRAHDSAYSQWEQIVQEEPEEVDLQLPEVDKHVEQKAVIISEPKVKFRQKKVDALGAGLVEFKKRKMNSRNLKQRADS